MTGFRAIVVVDEPANCPVAAVSRSVDEAVDSVIRTRPSGPRGETVVEEFGLPATASPEVDVPETDVELTPVQANDREAVYRFERECDAGCACELVEGTGTPISSVRARDGSLELSFHTLELETLVEAVAALRERFEGVFVRDLTRDPEEGTTDPVTVDRDALTERQLEVLETAREMGYFEYPKEANATEVADELAIARSTFSEHLAAAQTKLLDDVLEQ